MTLTLDELKAIKDLAMNAHSIAEWHSKSPGITEVEKKNLKKKSAFYLGIYNKLLGAR